MNNRILKRPMFRMGGSPSNGIMTGLDQPRKAFQAGSEGGVLDSEDAAKLDEIMKEKQIGPYLSQESVDEGMKNLKQKNFDELGFDEGDMMFPMTGQKKKSTFNLEDLKEGDDGVKTEFEKRLALRDSLLGKSALPMSSFLTQFGLNLASASPKGNIFSTAAEAAKEPLKTFQAMKIQERSEDKDLLESVIESMSEEDLSSLEKKVKRGVESGFFKNEAEGYNVLLKKEIEGVQYGPGELDRINVARYADAYVRSDAGEDLTVPAAESIFRVYQQVEKGKVEGADASQFDPSRYHISGGEKQAEIVDGQETGRDIIVLSDELDKQDYFKGNIYVNPGENKVYRFDGNKFVSIG
jgi:hypothetical protein